MNPLRVAVIGAGGIAQRNAKETAASGVATVAGVFDVNIRAAKDLARALGVPVFESYEQALERADVDAVLLSTPHHLHVGQTVQAAAARKHILVEKPIATTIDDADTMVRACRKAGVMLGVNYSFRYLPKIQKARQLVRDGALGDIVGIQAIEHQFKDPGYWMGARSTSPDDWRSCRAKSGGGFLIMNVCHVIDYLYFITGEKATKIYSEYGTFGSPGDVEDVISVTFRFGKSGVGSISASSIMRGTDQAEERIWGTNGTLVINGEGLSFYSTRPIDGKKPGRMHRYEKFAAVSWTAEWVRQFVTAIREGREPEVASREGWENLAFISTAYQSLQVGGPLTVPEYAL